MPLLANRFVHVAHGSTTTTTGQGEGDFTGRQIGSTDPGKRKNGIWKQICFRIYDLSFHLVGRMVVGSVAMNAGSQVGATFNGITRILPESLPDAAMMVGSRRLGRVCMPAANRRPRYTCAHVGVILAKVFEFMSKQPSSRRAQVVVVVVVVVCNNLDCFHRFP